MKHLLNNVKTIISILILTISFVGCENSDDFLPEITAGFTHTINQETGTVTFINTSSEVRSYLWNFGDGTTSTEINPIKSYPNGTYTITLEIKNAAGATDTFEDTITIDGIVTCDVETAESMSAASLNMTFKTDPTANFINDGANFSWTANPDTENEINPSCYVGKIVKQGVNPWDNTQYNLDAKLDFTANGGLKIKVYSAKAGFKVRIKLEEIGNPGNNTELEVPTTKTSAWEELTFPFASTLTNKFNKIVIFFDLDANNKDTYYFDDLKVYTRTDGGGSGAFDDGLLTNGNFENGANSWIIGVGTTPAPVKTVSGNTFYSVNVTAAGNSYDVNLSQKLAIVQGSTYTLTFDAWSDRARTMLAGIGLSGGDFSNTVQTVNIATTRTTYTLTLSAANFGASDARVLFDLGAAIGEVNIDNVSLVLKTSTGGGTGGTGTTSGLAQNSDFETGALSGWIAFQNGGTAALDNTTNNGGSWSGKLVTNGPSNPAFKQERVGAGVVKAGDVITVKFDLKGSVVQPGAVFNVLLFGEGAAGASFTKVFSPAPTLTNTWTTFTGTYTIAPGTDVSGGLSFLIEAVCGGDAGCKVTANIDNVLVKVN